MFATLSFALFLKTSLTWLLHKISPLDRKCKENPQKTVKWPLNVTGEALHYNLDVSFIKANILCQLCVLHSFPV